MLLSVIIPVFNMEKYLPECFSSIVRAEPSLDVEFLFINDGSIDETKNLLKEFYNKYYKILNLVIIDQVNSGVSSARNKGLENARGDYLAFIDPDDVIDKSYFSTLLPIIRKTNVDIVQFSAKRFYIDIDDGTLITRPLLSNGFYDLSFELKIKIFDQSFWVCWLRIFKRSLFNKITFPSIYSSEDLAVLPYIFMNAKSIFFINDSLYFYRFNPYSLTANKNFGYVERAENSYKYIFNDFMKGYASFPLLSSAIIPIMRGHIQFLLENKGYDYAALAWKNYKILLKKSEFDSNLIYKTSNRLFYYFGVWFLIILIGMKKSIFKR